jgi:hypothetical protein
MVVCEKGIHDDQTGGISISSDGCRFAVTGKTFGPKNAYPYGCLYLIQYDEFSRCTVNGEGVPVNAEYVRKICSTHAYFDRCKAFVKRFEKEREEAWSWKKP